MTLERSAFVNDDEEDAAGEGLTGCCCCVVWRALEAFALPRLLAHGFGQDLVSVGGVSVPNGVRGSSMGVETSEDDASLLPEVDLVVSVLEPASEPEWEPWTDFVGPRAEPKNRDRLRATGAVYGDRNPLAASVCVCGCSLCAEVVSFSVADSVADVRTALSLSRLPNSRFMSVGALRIPSKRFLGILCATGAQWQGSRPHGKAT